MKPKRSAVGEPRASPIMYASESPGKGLQGGAQIYLLIESVMFIQRSHPLLMPSPPALEFSPASGSLGGGKDRVREGQVVRRWTICSSMRLPRLSGWSVWGVTPGPVPTLVSTLTCATLLHGAVGN